MSDLLRGSDGRRRCAWPGEDVLYREYHDAEWGRPEEADRALFEKLALEGFQAGLSWITVLRKREALREQFAGFEPAAVARFGERQIGRMLGDARIIRHRGKIESAINNAGQTLEIIDEFGSLAAYVWAYSPGRSPAPRGFSDLRSITPASTALGKDLKRRGWSFVGPTTVHAFMQAMGMVNDHLVGCWVRGECERLRRSVAPRYPRRQS
jgi:DNA-3-methyladenine glycosylase I